eukprot:CAMPEP_0202046970 /NCGR_PEP_ID=MMETSP0963-20130614/1606_1 /ASSEMBLY_ACC=CAM_ASM_000494 /TAXON_ID=4773 /ORGANISM="Schizochytrium aggregatum, Strain ATCC28209" /LENGTH=183 /DNA_ID=CAMNT_0048611645 /DNA_START=369 /DNA_END=915 /DNA_ORIENTATION=-
MAATLSISLCSARCCSSEALFASSFEGLRDSEQAVSGGANRAVEAGEAVLVPPLVSFSDRVQHSDRGADGDHPRENLIWAPPAAALDEPAQPSAARLPELARRPAMNSAAAADFAHRAGAERSVAQFAHDRWAASHSGVAVPPAVVPLSRLAAAEREGEARRVSTATKPLAVSTVTCTSSSLA